MRSRGTTVALGAAWLILAGVAGCETQGSDTAGGTSAVDAASPDGGAGGDIGAATDTGGPGDSEAPDDLSGPPDSGGGADALPRTDTGSADAAPVDIAGPPCTCTEDAQCPTGQRCVDTGAGGACVSDYAALYCWEDADCEQGACLAARACPCDANCVSEPGICEGVFNGCCTADEHCAAGAICAGIPGLGSCHTPAPAGTCWRDADCAAGATCYGAALCPCDVDCDMIDAPGTCVSAPPAGCCTQDADCGEANAVCADVPGGDGGFGLCVMAPATGQCWDDGDCPADQTCAGSSACPCGALCGMISAPGTCQPKGDELDCCSSDAACKAGLVCAPISPLDPWGVCEQPASAGACWRDADCGPGQACSGPTVCPCTADCLLADSAGTCVAKTPQAGCCFADADCGAGTVCTEVPGAPDDGSRTCAPALPAGQCWDASDCAAGWTCQGATVCPCQAVCDAVQVAGQCVPDKPSGQCYVVSGADFGDCLAVLGVIFDGTQCKAVSGCSCAPHCDAFFSDLASCEAACGFETWCAAWTGPGCVASGCPSGQQCDTSFGCVPSACSCDVKTGDMICTADCGGGTCVPAP